METPQTHFHATATVTLLWKRHQGPNMSQYIHIFINRGHFGPPGANFSEFRVLPLA
jgi:hypothetical protein